MHNSYSQNETHQASREEKINLFTKKRVGTIHILEVSTMFGHHQKQEGNQPAIDYRKQQKHHKHMEQLGQLGTVAVGAYAMVQLH